MRGKQEEVAATSFEKEPRRLDNPKRFTCPYCGEEVFFAGHIENGKQAVHFRHHKESENGAECEKRAESRNYYSIYEKAGLPLYIEKSGKGFELKMGFRALPDSLLSEAEIEGQEIIITDDFNSRKYVSKVNHTYFGDFTRYITLDFIPPYGRDYHIYYNQPNTKERIAKYWSTIAKGFGKNGAIFKKNKSGGKKLGNWNLVTKDCVYYLVVMKDSCPKIKGIKSNIVGKMLGKLSNYFVYELIINVDSNSKDYNELDLYLRDNFEVKLVDEIPSLKVLWPPTIEYQQMSSFIPFGNRIFGIVQPNEPTRKVYEHCELEKPREILQKDGLVSFTTFCDKTITVGKQYTLPGLILNKFNLNIQEVGFCPTVELKIKDQICFRGSNTAFISQDKKIIELSVCVDVQSVIEHRHYSEVEIILNNRKVKLCPKDSLNFYWNNDFNHTKYAQIQFVDNRKKNDKFDPEDLKKIIAIQSPLVCMSSGTRIIIKQLLADGKYSFLKIYYAKNVIPYAVLKYLYKGNGRDE